MFQTRKGFSLIEIVITVMIIVILSLISGPVYNTYAKKAKESEGYALLGTLRSAEEHYYRQYKQFYSQSAFTCNNDVLGVDVRHSKYYTSFAISYMSGHVGFIAYTRANGAKNLQMTYNLTLPCSVEYMTW